MKIYFDQGTLQFSSKASVFSIDEIAKGSNSDDRRRVTGVTNQGGKALRSLKDDFLIDCEGRFEVNDLFVESLYINEDKDKLAFYLLIEDVRLLYVGDSLKGKGEDTQKRLGRIDVLVVRPAEGNDLDQINKLIGHYSPNKVVILLDHINVSNLDKVYKHFGKISEDVIDNFKLKSQDIDKDSEVEVEFILMLKKENL